jgi:hypothetical protein
MYRREMNQCPPVMGFEQAFRAGEHLGSLSSESRDRSIRERETVEVDDRVMRDSSRRAVDTGVLFSGSR